MSALITCAVCLQLLRFAITMAKVSRESNADLIHFELYNKPRLSLFYSRLGTTKRPILRATTFVVSTV